VIGVALDNAERRTAERALRLSEQSYRSLIEETPYGICRSTLGGQFLQVNRAMVEMLAFDSETELNGQTPVANNPLLRVGENIGPAVQNTVDCLKGNLEPPR